MNDQVVNHEVNDQPAEQATTAVASEQQRTSAGTQLTMLRQARGWTIEQVASQLNLAPRQVEALETDHYEALPGLVIVRGFIRAYAKLLRVDPAPMLAAVEPQAASANILPERAPLSASFSETSVPFGKRRGPSLPIVIGGIAVLCGVLFFAAQRSGWIPSFDRSVSTAQDGSVTKELPVEVTTPVEPTTPQQTFSEDAPPSAAASPSEPAVVTPPTAASAPAATTSDVAPAASVAAPRPAPAATVTNPTNTQAPAVNAASNPVVAAEGQKLLGLQAKEDSWVEVKRPDNSIVVSRIFKAGSSESFAISGPVSIVVGNASAVTVSVAGQPLEIKPSSNNVARLNIN
ncbi:RodZ domain-containing protein [uncultured Oxalicibacterium sp.]|uniref:helix-turn-helix domain-containing protein n=1 Tax=uncultured Oxalicibacterium sp. TaxID=1168540 RepID=UPI0025EDF50C|nr:RodZ domain-containing protein [uncultured Oxalicibacterium sp.]